MDTRERSGATDALLDEMQWVADPPADATVAAIVGRWDAAPGAATGVLAASADEAARRGADADRVERLRALNAIVSEWHDNATVAGWRANARQAEEGFGAPLEAYVKLAGPLPPWADAARIRRAEDLFWDYGALSVTLLFCASLPECYVVPDLAEVLHATGQLEKRAEHRIRTTGAMIFPVMMKGGLITPNGAGIAQILKVRLIHATVRNLILRASPEHALEALRAAPEAARDELIPALAEIRGGDSMHAALFAKGWDLDANALPNNQEELAYTLLTFSYVFLRGMRRLGLGFTRQEEEDYLHAWNVAGHFLGIRRELMVDTMEEAAALFARMQSRGRAEWARRPEPTDVRPALAAALMDAMKSVIPVRILKPFPVLLSRRLMEPESIRDLRLDGHVSWPARALFALVMGAARGIDAVVRLAFPHFSICRLLARAAGYRLLCALMMSETHELAVPDRLRPGIKGLIRSWGDDPKAGPVMNRIEDVFTGEWVPLERPPR